MAQRAHFARRACGTALMAMGILVLTGLVVAAAAFIALREAAIAKRSPAITLPSPTDLAADQGQSTRGNVDWEYLQALNPDIVAWITIPGTAIDHPVVLARADEPQFYLSHDVHGNWNPFGCLYIDATCVEGLASNNVIIYGHNMGDDSMLGGLVNYRDSEWANGHRTIELETPTSMRYLTVAGVDTVPGSEEHKRTAFADEDDFRQYAQEKLNACDVRLDNASEANGRLFTLCTCSYFRTPEDERTLVYAFGCDTTSDLASHYDRTGGSDD